MKTLFILKQREKHIQSESSHQMRRESQINPTEGPPLLSTRRLLWDESFTVFMKLQ